SCARPPSKRIRRELHKEYLRNPLCSEPLVECSGKVIRVIDGPDYLPRACLTRNSCGGHHKSPAHPFLPGLGIHIQIYNVQIVKCSVRVVTKVVEQVANDQSIVLGHQAFKSGPQTKPVPQIRLSGQLKVGLVTKRAEITGKLLCQTVD